MNTACAAPRLRASMPTAPVPAKMSRKREPEILGARTLKRVSRRRSLVGRRALPLRDFKMRLRYLPAMIRMDHLFQKEKALRKKERPNKINEVRASQVGMRPPPRQRKLFSLRARKINQAPIRHNATVRKMWNASEWGAFETKLMKVVV